MAKVYDIKIDANGEDMVKNGDDFIDESTQQHSQLLIIWEKGENKMEPDSGVGITSWILDEEGPLDLKKEIQSELEGDGQKLDYIRIESLEDFKVAGSYGK